jgi:hypothetical protein
LSQGSFFKQRRSLLLSRPEHNGVDNHLHRENPSAQGVLIKTLKVRLKIIRKTRY